jgi:hypothetical protein
MGQFFFRRLLYLFITCVGIASVRLGGPHIITPSFHNKGETMSKRPPLGTSGKLALAGKRKLVRQLLDREQRECDRRGLLSLVAGSRPEYQATDGVAVVVKTGVTTYHGSPRPQQLNKPPPPKLPAVPLGGRRRRVGR